MYTEHTIDPLMHSCVPSGVRRYVSNGDAARLKWRLKFWKRWLFAWVAVDWFGFVERVGLIEQKHKKILWINLAAPSIGDSLMDLSARVLLVDRCIDLLTHPKNVFLYHKDIYFRSVSDDPLDYIGRDYDLVICDSFSPRVLIRKLCIAPRSPYVGLYEFINGYEVHRTYFAFARMKELLALNRIDVSRRPIILSSSKSVSFTPNIDVCIAVGGEWAFRTYDHWPAIVNWLVTQGCTVSLVGSGNGIKQAEVVTQQEPSVRSTVGQSSLVEAIEEIKQATIFVGADGGLWHIACAISKPTVVLFADCQMFDHQGKRVTRETQDMICECLYDDDEVSKIKPGAVIAAIQDLWAKINTTST